MPKVSIIIPVYNVEKYLKRCLDSVINQTYKHIEIICINDCSTDNSSEILQEYAKQDERVKIIDLEKNKGISAARNAGFGIATGEYIYFLDSDDWIDLDYIEKMIKAMQNANADVVYNNSINTGDYYIDFLDRKNLNKFSDKFIDAKKAILTIPRAVWAYMWKKAFLDRINIKFPEGYRLEDVYFHVLTLAYLDKLLIINESVYHYWIRDMRQFKKNSTQTILKTYNLIYDDCKEKGLLETSNIRIVPDIFILLKQCVDENVDLKILKEYFKKIEGAIYTHRSIYSKCELCVFEDVINDNEISMEKYLKLYHSEKIRFNIKNRIKSNK